MRAPRVRFTIRGLMIAVLVTAGLLSLPARGGPILIPILITCLSLGTARWFLLRADRRLAAFCFWGPAIMANVVFAALCVSPEVYFLGLLFVGWLLIVMPTIAGFGITWAILASRKGEASRRSPPAAWLSVIALVALPVVTAWTLWPLRLGFLTTRPALERLADRVATGQVVRFPQWVGPFRVAGSGVDPTTGNVGLMIDPSPGGPTGFVRVGPGTPSNQRHRPIRGDDLEVQLGGGWWYHEED